MSINPDIIYFVFPMKKIFPSLFLLLVFTLISCSTAENPPEPEVPEVVAEEDTYNFIALRNDGQLFEIGNKTGKISSGNKIQGIEFNTLFNGVTSTGSTLYVYEHRFDPFQAYIHEYNLVTGTNKTHEINFSEDVFGPYAGLISLEYDEQNNMLLALVKENFEENHPLTSRVARIDPVTFEVSSLDIEINKGHIMGTLLKDNNIYASSYKTSTGSGENDFFKIDLSNGSINRIALDNISIPPIHLSHNVTKNTLFGFLPVPGSTFLGASEPVIMNPGTGEITYLLPEEITGNKHQFGRSIYHPATNEHVDIITSPTYNALFRYNAVTQEVNVIHLPNPNDLSSLVTLVGAVKVE
jgi:hypothetical protein